MLKRRELVAHCGNVAQALPEQDGVSKLSLHSFDPDVACKVGINAAVIYQNFVFWCQKNAANRKLIRDGYVWTYNSRRALSELFPYLTESQIKTAISKLLEVGLLVKGEYNVAAYDKTNWYSPAMSAEWVSAIGQKSPMDWSKIANGLAKNGQPIPDSKPDSKPDEDTNVSLALSAPEPSSPISEAVEIYNDAASQVGWPKVQKLTPARAKVLKARLAECGGVEGWRIAMDKGKSSDFLSGRATGSTPANFDWITKQANFTKLMEGNYDNRNNRNRHNAERRENRPDPALENIFRLAGLGKASGNGCG